MAISRRSKKVITTALACALMVVLAVGVTLAYLSATTEELVNNFTFLGGDDISAELTEPNWDEDEATNMMPGETVAKDPIITNTSSAEGMSEYVAMQVTFADGEGNPVSAAQLAKLANLITISWNEGSGWVTGAGTGVSGTSIGSSASTIYYYDAVLSNVSGSNSTPALFTSVTISITATNDDLTWLSTTTADVNGVPGLGGFQIIVNGAAVQAQGFDGNVSGSGTLAYTELAGLFS